MHSSGRMEGLMNKSLLSGSVVSCLAVLLAGASDRVAAQAQAPSAIVIEGGKGRHR